jgi:hypothetical protein
MLSPLTMPKAFQFFEAIKTEKIEMLFPEVETLPTRYNIEKKIVSPHAHQQTDFGLKKGNDKKRD